ncbi:MAG: hypothetical protein U0798_09270 [Gemmataceae bacterium]
MAEPAPKIRVAKLVDYKPDGEPAPVKDQKAARQFPCPSCAARLDFDPSAKGLKCPYCGYEKTIEKSADAEIVERDYLEYLSREESKGKVIEGRSNEVRCTGCGANVLLEDKVITERCPYCLTFLQNQPTVAKQMIPPESVLPFALDLRKAREAFEQWMKGLWFAPNGLSKLSSLGQLSGVYVPYWTYDANTQTFYHGQRGDDYTDTEWYTETMSDGSTRQASRTVVRTRWSSASGEVRHFFDDVLICASKSIRGDLIQVIRDWQLRKLEPFSPAYLSGFRTERYALGLKEGFAKSKEVMEDEIVRLIRRDIGGDHQRIDDKQSRYSAITFKHILLPVWLAVYRYNGKTFQILVNGRTGTVAGDRPYSFWKIGAVIVAIIFAIIAVSLIIAKVKH